VRRSLGYLPEHNALYENMRVDRLLAFAGRARGLRGARLEERIEWVTERCRLGEVMSKRVAHCSKGFRQRIGTAAALIHDPPVLVLDEPTHGLDPLQVVAFREFLEELREGRTILFSSHILAEVTAISSRLLILNEGRLLADSSLAEIEERAAQDGSDIERTVLDIVRTGGTSR
jgi:ABC-2 type transport system ATP-binding protein